METGQITENVLKMRCTGNGTAQGKGGKDMEAMVLVVDDNKADRDDTEGGTERESDMEVVGTASDERRHFIRYRH